MEKELLQIRSDIASLSTEMKTISRTLQKVEKVLENQAVMLEKQNVANKRITKLEDNDEKIQVRVRKLEDWQLRIIAMGSVIGAIAGFLVNKLF